MDREMQDLAVDRVELKYSKMTAAYRSQTRHRKSLMVFKCCNHLVWLPNSFIFPFHQIDTEIQHYLFLLHINDQLYFILLIILTTVRIIPLCDCPKPFFNEICLFLYIVINNSHLQVRTKIEFSQKPLNPQILKTPVLIVTDTLAYLRYCQIYSVICYLLSKIFTINHLYRSKRSLVVTFVLE